jgi:hypothetical protein
MSTQKQITENFKNNLSDQYTNTNLDNPASTLISVNIESNNISNDHEDKYIIEAVTFDFPKSTYQFVPLWVTEEKDQDW